MAAAPVIATEYTQLPSDPAQRHQAFADLFGQHLFHLRSERLALVRSLVVDPEKRESLLGAIQRRPYEEVGKQAPEAVEASLSLARATVDLYIQHLLAMLSNLGGDMSLGESHAIRYRLVLEIVDKRTLALVEEQVINRDTSKSFGDYFGRWLNRYGVGEATTVSANAADAP